MPAMPYYRGLDNELKHIGDVGPATDDPWSLYDERFTYFPDDSLQPIVDGINFGRYDETGGEVGNQQRNVVADALVVEE